MTSPTDHIHRHGHTVPLSTRAVLLELATHATCTNWRGHPRWTARTTLATLAATLHVSTRTVHRHLTTAIAAGLLTRDGYTLILPTTPPDTPGQPAPTCTPTV